MATIVKFVRTRNDDEASARIMQEAFEETNEGADDGECVWFTEEECLEVTERRKKMFFVFDFFSGPAFDHLVKSNHKICGPVVLLESMRKGQQLPRSQRFTYSFSLRGKVICCTGIEKNLRERLYARIGYMLGEVSKDFHEKVTHLVAGEAGSKKYLVAANLNKPIYTAAWVNALFEASGHRVVDGDDPEFDSFKCPPLLGQVVTVSGIDSEERGEIKRLVEKAGGAYSGEMKISVCTHLIVNTPKGQKYEFAKKWKIAVVKPEWLYDSVKLGYCCDVDKYKVQGNEAGGPQTSTPNGNKDNTRMSTLGDMSVISVSTVNETAMNQTTNATAYLNTTRQEAANVTREGGSTHPLDDLDIASIKTKDFLDGCVIYPSGFEKKRLVKLRRIINVGGATRLDQLNDKVTHVVMDERCEEDVRCITTEGLRPHIVSVHWLLDSMKQNQRLSEDPYKCLELPDDSAPITPVSKPKPKKSNRETEATKSPESQNDTTLQGNKTTNMDKSDMQDIMSQYLPQNNTGFTTGDGSTLIRAMDAALAQDENQQPAEGSSTAAARVSNASHTRSAGGNEEDEETQNPSEEDDEGGGNLFSGKTFVLFGFEGDYLHELSEIIREVQGTVFERNKVRGIPDFAVVPLWGAPVDLTVGEVVTETWVQMCLENEELLKLSDDELFTPMAIKSESAPLHGCVISISGFQGAERKGLLDLAQELGAHCQEYFVKRETKGGLVPSTHLIANEPGGPKYQAAKNWGKHAVTKQWLFDSARKGLKESEEFFSVDNPEAHKPYSIRAAETPSKNTSKLNTSDKENVTTADDDDVTEELTDVSMNTTKTPKSSAATPNTSKAQPQSNSRTANKLDGASRTNEATDIRVPSNAEVSPAVLREENSSKATNLRIQTIKEQSQKERRRSSTGADGVETPSKFLTVGGPSFRPKYDLADFEAALVTPANERRERRDSTPMSELLSRCMTAALKNTAAGPHKHPAPATPGPATSAAAAALLEDEPSGPLKGVVIAVSKKLSGRQSDLNNMAAELGADYRWTYDDSCTHFIFQGKAKDTSSEFRTARNHKKIIVSPHWLETCAEQNARVDENLFPHTYNPNLTLSLTPAPRSVKSTRALRSTRSTKPTVPEEDPAAPVSPAPQDPKQRLEFVETVSEASPKRRGRLTRAKKQQQEKEQQPPPERPQRTRRPAASTAAVEGDEEKPRKRTRQQTDGSTTEEEETGDPTEAPEQDGGGGGAQTRATRRRNAATAAALETGKEAQEKAAAVALKSRPQRGGKRAAREKEDREEKEEGDDELNEAEMEDMVKLCERVEQQEKEKAKKGETQSYVSNIQQFIQATRSYSKERKTGLKRNGSSDSLEEPELKRARSDLSVAKDAPEEPPEEIVEIAEAAEVVEVDKDKSSKASSSRTSLTRPNKGALPAGASQMVEVGWDDPSAREQRKRLADELAKHSESMSPRAGEAAGDAHNTSGGEPTTPHNRISPRLDLLQKKQTKQQSSEDEYKAVPTPEHPSLALAVVKRPHRKELPKPVMISVSNRDGKTPTLQPRFLLSGLTQEERDDYGVLAEQLGGVVSDVLHYDSTCTHLVVGAPSRNEKYLACVAAGKWILHKSYFEACRKQRGFVDEEGHEWGGDAMAGMLAKYSGSTPKLARAARSWRLQLCEKRREHPTCVGAFEGWNVVVLTESKREEGFRRLLEAGGATVQSGKPPFSDVEELTHAFMDLSKYQHQVDLDVFVNAGVSCVKPDYIAAYLTDHPAPRIEQYTIPELGGRSQAQSNSSRPETLMTLTNRSKNSFETPKRKRLPSNAEVRDGKRSRIVR